jgi:NADH:ubiquinone oxidoreductase subunit E
MSATRNEMGGERAPGDLAHGLHESTPHVPVFTGARRKELDELLTRYPTKMAALLPRALDRAGERGWVSSEAMAEVAQVLEPHARVREGRRLVLHDVPSAPGRAALHPGLHRRRPATCAGRGCRERAPQAHGCEELGVTSPTASTPVIEVECLGACGFATPVMVNEKFIESVTPETVPALLASLG